MLTTCCESWFKVVIGHNKRQGEYLQASKMGRKRGLPARAREKAAAEEVMQAIEEDQRESLLHSKPDDALFVVDAQGVGSSLYSSIFLILIDRCSLLLARNHAIVIAGLARPLRLLHRGSKLGYIPTCNFCMPQDAWLTLRFRGKALEIFTWKILHVQTYERSNALYLIEPHFHCASSVPRLRRPM